jgi:hypothetical protein
MIIRSGSPATLSFRRVDIERGQENVAIQIDYKGF